MSFLSRFSSSKRLSKKPPAGPAARTAAPVVPALDLPDLPSPSFAAPGNGGGTPETASTASDGERASASGAWVRVAEPAAGVEGKEQTRVREEAEKRRLARARLGVASASVLLELCAKVVRERGTTTLGLFRPYRLAEDPREMRKLALLFLAYADAVVVPGATGMDASDPVVRDIFGAGVSSKQGNLDIFKEELKYASVHDVVGLLKWGLRHLRYSTSFSGSTLGPLTWYGSFYSQASPPDAFTSLLLPTLPGSSQTLLLSTLRMVEAVAAQAEVNAMGARRLSRHVGAYVFGTLDADRSGQEWRDLYTRWAESGDAMEGVLKSYLRAQGVEGLPKRLREVVGGWPKDVGPEGRKVSVLKVEMVTKGEWREVGVNSQSTGLEGGDAAGGAGRKRRKPLVILTDAIAATTNFEGPDDDAHKAWTLLSQLGQGRPLDVLSDETNRILHLVDLAALPIPLPATSPSLLSPLSPSSSFSSNLRRRSLSHEPTPTPTLPALPEDEAGSREGSPYGTASHRFPNKSVSNLQTARPSSSWSEFALSGFGDDLPTSELGLVQRPATAGATRSPGTFKSQTMSYRNKGLPRSPSESSVPSRREQQEPVQPATTIKSISIVQLDEEFEDFYLDTLNDPACDSWPSFILSDLHSAAIAQLAAMGIDVDHVLVAETLVPFADERPATEPTLSRAMSNRSATASLADSTMSRRWNKRMSSLFTGSLASKARYANSITSPDLPTLSSPPSSPAPKLPTTPLTRTVSRSESIKSTTKSITRRLSISKRASKSSLPSSGTNGIPSVPILPLEYSPPPKSPVSPVAFSDSAVSPPLPTETPASPLAPDVPDKDPPRPATPAKSSASAILPAAALVATPVAALAFASELAHHNSESTSPIQASETATASEPEPAPAPEHEPEPKRYSVEMPPITRSEDEMHQGRGTEISDFSSFVPSEASTGVHESDMAADDMEYHAVDIEEPSVEEKEVAPPHVEEPAPVVEEKAPLPIEEEPLVHADEPVAQAEEPVVHVEEPVVVVAATPEPEPIEVSSPPPTFEVSPPVEAERELEPETVSEVGEDVLGHKESAETLRRPAAEVAALEAQDHSEEAPADNVESHSELETPAIDHSKSTSEDSTADSLIPSSPASTTASSIPPSPTVGHALSPSLTHESATSTTASPGPSPSVSSKSGSKRFLGSATIGTLLRRKKSGVPDEGGKIEKKTKAELKEAKKRELIEQKKEQPKPVSSVKKRVLEIEAAARADAAAATAKEGEKEGTATDDKPSTSSSPEAPEQESSHLAAKAPVALGARPSEEVTPTPTRNPSAAHALAIDTAPSSPAAEPSAPSTPGRSSVGDSEDTPSTPTAQDDDDPTVVLHPASPTPAKHATSEDQSEALASRASSLSDEHVAHPNGKGEHSPADALQLHDNLQSATSLAETATSFQTAESEQSL
ncbi:hypothetical protein RQP46_006911 [Phenoliferia psychrophenolica]